MNGLASGHLSTCLAGWRHPSHGVTCASWDAESTAVQMSAGEAIPLGAFPCPDKGRAPACSAASHAPAGRSPESGGPERGHTRGVRDTCPLPPCKSPVHGSLKCNTKSVWTWIDHLRILGISSRLKRKLVLNLPPCHNCGGVKVLCAPEGGLCPSGCTAPTPTPWGVWDGARGLEVAEPRPASFVPAPC